LPDTGVGFVVNRSTYVQYASLSSPRLPWFRPKSRTDAKDLNSPVTWVDGAGYSVHRNGSKASSSFVLTGSHHPPALWKARNDYYSSSQPLQIFIILEKSNGQSQVVLFSSHQFYVNQTPGIFMTAKMKACFRTGNHLCFYPD
jgi:hypothetical protein